MARWAFPVVRLSGGTRPPRNVVPRDAQRYLAYWPCWAKNSCSSCQNQTSSCSGSGALRPKNGGLWWAIGGREGTGSGEAAPATPTETSVRAPDRPTVVASFVRVDLLRMFPQPPICRNGPGPFPARSVPLLRGVCKDNPRPVRRMSRAVAHSAYEPAPRISSGRLVHRLARATSRERGPQDSLRGVRRGGFGTVAAQIEGVFSRFTARAPWLPRWPVVRRSGSWSGP
jgi:hypothetical protein